VTRKKKNILVDISIIKGLTKVAPDWEVNMADLKVLGKREVMSLVKWKDRIKHIQYLKKII
jgi:hypothetical protein